MVLKKVVVALFIGAVLTACGDESSKQSNKSSGSSGSSQTASAGSAATPAAQPAQKKETDKIDEAIFALKFFSAGERDKAAVEAKRILSEIDMKVGELEGKADPAAIKTLKDEGTQAQAEVAKLAADSETVWWKVANAYAKALLDHKRNYDKLASGAEVAKSGG